jgi:hypothetical protein
MSLLRILRLGLGLAALGAAGCATVGVADKEAFTWPCMDFDKTRPGEGFVRHVFLTQEQADGGDGGEGGGCGCR